MKRKKEFAFSVARYVFPRAFFVPLSRLSEHVIGNNKAEDLIVNLPIMRYTKMEEMVI